jgi:hypothetical protein
VHTMLTTLWITQELMRHVWQVTNMCALCERQVVRPGRLQERPRK